MPFHLELTLGTCSGILTDDTLVIFGGVFRPGFSAICFRASFCICRKASADGSFVKRDPRKDDFFLLFVFDAVDGADGADEADEVAEVRTGRVDVELERGRLEEEEEGGEEEEEDEKKKGRGKEGDRRPWSRSVEVVTVLLVVTAVPIVLVDSRDRGERYPDDGGGRR